MIRIRSHGSFKNTESLLSRITRYDPDSVLKRYGEYGVQRLEEFTPVDSGLTASSWSYEIVKEGSSTRLVFNNSNVNHHVNIAIILQYGHATRNGGWVEGVDYINPALQPIFQALADSLWKEVTGHG